MLKISKAVKSDRSVTLKLEGSVVGPWVGELRQVCEPLLAEGQTPNLDLADVTFADASGLAALAQFQLRGVRVLNCSPFMTEQMKTVPTD